MYTARTNRQALYSQTRVKGSAMSNVFLSPFSGHSSRCQDDADTKKQKQQQQHRETLQTMMMEKNAWFLCQCEVYKYDDSPFFTSEWMAY